MEEVISDRGARRYTETAGRKNLYLNLARLDEKSPHPFARLLPPAAALLLSLRRDGGSKRF
jgi:hypothetical protein